MRDRPVDRAASIVGDGSAPSRVPRGARPRGALRPGRRRSTSRTDALLGDPAPRERGRIPIVRRSQRYEGLTPEGERLVAGARRILAGVVGLDAELDAMRGGLSGQLRIGAIPTSLPSGLAPDDSALAGRTARAYGRRSSLNSRQIERGRTSSSSSSASPTSTPSRSAASVRRPLPGAVHAPDRCRRPWATARR